MSRKPCDDALAIWQAGVDAVRSDELVRRFVHVRDRQLTIGPHRWPLDTIRQIEIVGAGKAGAGMAAGLEQALGPEVLSEKNVNGWINVPADCVRPLSRIQLHAARPAACNEPAPEGVVGSAEILRRVQSLHPHDLCICLISGGGSALLPAPRPGIALDELLHVTRTLSAAGATIQQLNSVRKQLSRIQGGGLARACRAGWLVTLIISDVMGDPLEIIASGPTVVEPDPAAAAQRAIDIVQQYEQAGARFDTSLRQRLRVNRESMPVKPITSQVINLVIGNNQTATQAAQRHAERLGYDVRLAPPQPASMTAEEVGQGLADMLLEPPHVRDRKPPWCVISGGEPVVKLVPVDERGRGGRNQQLTLAALCRLLATPSATGLLKDQAVLSGGTDGEDGPTDAAGAWIDQDVLQQMVTQALEPGSFLRRNDAYSFFQAVGGLIRTGPTHTNVCDIRVVLAQ